MDVMKIFNFLKKGDVLSHYRVVFLNFSIMLIYMLICKSTSKGVDYISMGEAMNKQSVLFWGQILINLGFVAMYFFKKSTYNWQVMLSSIFALWILHFLVFLFLFFTWN